MKLSWTKKGIAWPEGFMAAGIASGIKKKGQKDLTLIYSEAPAVGAGVFTKNNLTAWPLQWSKKSLRFPYHHAILASSGNANCFNGPTGKQAVEVGIKTLSKQLDIPKESIFIAQTGVIGRPFPVQTFKKGIGSIVPRLSEKGTGASLGILTTDTRPKECAFFFKVKGKTIRMASIAKGSGMIHPDMGTLFVFVTTDLNISKPVLQKVLREVNAVTFNRMSIDNDLSTNDCVFVLANGLAGNRRIKSVREAAPFQEVLLALCRKQRLELVKDGEGVKTVCTVEVVGAKTESEAEKGARHISNSMLFKTMLTGADPNWGRVAAAIGATGIPVNFNKIRITFDGIPVLVNGKPLERNLPRVRRLLKRGHFTLKVDLKRGKEKVDFVTSDLTKQYVHINSEYTT